MLKLFRGPKGSPNQTPVSMVGARPGDSVLFCGGTRPDIAGEVGAITGLNGQTTVVDPAGDTAERVAEAASTAGALVDHENAPLNQIPFDDGTWDAVVLVSGLQALGPQGDAVMAEAIRVIRPGGRLVVFDPIGRPGFLGRNRPSAVVAPAQHLIDQLGATGLRAVRLLAEADGVRYFEGVKPRT